MMISTEQSSTGLDGLGFSLKPPKWLRNAVSTVVNSGVAKVTVPTASGPVEVNKDSIQAAADLLRNAKLTVNPGAKPSTPADQAQDFVQSNIPGGWLTIMGVGLVGVVLLTTLLGGRGRR